MKLFFYMHGYPKKQPIDSNIYIESVQALSEIHPRYFQNDEVALYTSRANGSMK